MVNEIIEILKKYKKLSFKEIISLIKINRSTLYSRLKSLRKSKIIDYDVIYCRVNGKRMLVNFYFLID